MIQPKRIDLLAVGHVTLDAYDTPAGRTTLEPGGSVLYAARAWRALSGSAAGRRPGIVTTVGDDFRTPSAFTGLTVSAAPAPRTTRFANRYLPNGDRHQHLAAQAPRIFADQLPAEWSEPRAAFLCPVLGEVEITSWRKALGGANLIAAGLQGWLKRADGDGTVIHGPESESGGLDPRAFHGLDVAFLSVEDLAGRLDWLDALCKGVPLVYLTRGTAGCLIFRRGAGSGGCDRVGIFATGAVDPTGAGDTFAAGTLHALAEGADPIAAARVGAAAASVVVEYRANAPMYALSRAPARIAQVA